MLSLAHNIPLLRVSILKGGTQASLPPPQGPHLPQPLCSLGECSASSQNEHHLKPSDRQQLHPTTCFINVNQFIHPLCQCVLAKSRHLLLLRAPSTTQYSSASTSICKVSSFIFHAGCPAYSASLDPGVNSFFSFQMAALNFECILLMLKDRGSILQDTLQSQDKINLGDIRFCPLLCTLHMQHLSLDGLCTLLTKGMFVPLQSERPPKLSRTTVILLVFQADNRHQKIINVYVGLVVC